MQCKEIYQPKQYRFLGGIKRYDMSGNKNYIKYFKAWNASFEYKGFNLDMNNDIEYQCVLMHYLTHTELKKRNHTIIYIQFIMVD